MPVDAWLCRNTIYKEIPVMRYVGVGSITNA